MIEAHTFDAWTRPAVRASAVFRKANILGGLAAPLFLWLAGVGVAMSAAAVARRSGRRADGVSAVSRRGLEIFILAFLFRLQGLIVSPGGHIVTLFRVDILNIMGPSMVVAGLIWWISDRPAVQVGLYAAIACALAMLTPIVRVSPLVGTLADGGSVVRAAVRGPDVVHGVSVGGICVRRRCVRRAAFRRA